MNEAQIAKWAWARLPCVRCSDYVKETNGFLLLSMEGLSRLPDSARLEQVRQNLSKSPDPKRLKEAERR